MTRVMGGSIMGTYIEGEGVYKITVAATEPENPEEGDLWVDTS